MKPAERDRTARTGGGRQWLLALAGYLLLTVVVTWPVAAHLGRGPAGYEARDSFQYTWSLWWAGKAWLELGHGPAQLDYLYHPQGAYHPMLAATPLLEVTSLPLRFLPPVAVYNVQFLLSFVLCGLAVYLLCRELEQTPWASYVAGALFILFPHRIGHATAGHLTQLAGYWALFFLVSLRRFWRRPTWLRAVGTGTLLGLSLLVSPVVSAYFVAPLALFCALFWFILGDAKLFSRDVVLGIAIIGAVALTMSLPLLAPLLNPASGRLSYLAPEPGEALENAVDPAGVVVPSRYHPLWPTGDLLPAAADDSLPDLVERSSYLGIVALALAALGAAKRWRQAWPWLTLGAGGILLAMGPVLQVAGRLVQVGGPGRVIPLPYALLEGQVFYQWGRTPERFLQLTGLALAVLAGYGLSSVMEGRWTGWRQTVLTLAAVAWLALDYAVVWPFPQATVVAPEPLRAAAEDERTYAIASVPIAKRQISNYAMLYQTVHDHPIVGGYIHRDPPGTREWSKAFDAVFQAGSAQAAWDPAEGRAWLEGLGIGRLLIHADYVDAEEYAVRRALVTSWLGPPSYRDEALSIYSVPLLDAGSAVEPLATWDDALALEAVDVEQEAGALLVSLRWRCLAPMADDRTMAVALYDGDGGALVRSSEPPLEGRWPTSLWAAGETVLDVRRLALSEGLAPGAYDLHIAVDDLSPECDGATGAVCSGSELVIKEALVIEEAP